jgi:hypothetical protein
LPVNLLQRLRIVVGGWFGSVEQGGEATAVGRIRWLAQPRRRRKRKAAADFGRGTRHGTTLSTGTRLPGLPATVGPDEGHVRFSINTMSYRSKGSGIPRHGLRSLGKNCRQASPRDIAGRRRGKVANVPIDPYSNGTVRKRGA